MRTELRRHIRAIFRFIDRTDEAIYITYKGNDDLVLMSVKWYSELTGVDIAARIREGKELPTRDEILASACRRVFTHEIGLMTPDEYETRSSYQKELENDALAEKGELPEDELASREPRGQAMAHNA